MSGNSWAREKLKGFSKKCPGLLRLYRRSREDVKKKQFAALQRENPVDEKLVVFESFWGKSYSCSPKAIYEGMLRDKRYDDYHFIWSFQDTQLIAGSWKTPGPGWSRETPKNMRRPLQKLRSGYITCRSLSTWNRARTKFMWRPGTELR